MRLGAGFGLGFGRSGGLRNLMSASGVAAGLYLDTKSNSAFVSGTPSSLSSILNVVRATTAMDEYADGSLVSVGTNVARYGGGRGLLIERGATNPSLQSEDFASAPWINAGATVTANATTAPDGTTTPEQFDVTAAVGQGRYQVVTVTASTVYTVSWYTKLGTLPLATATYALRDDTAGAFISIDQPINAATNSSTWTRTTVTLTTPVGCTLLRIYPLRTSSASPAAGTAFYWGFQVEAGPFATSYIPTTTVAVTRNADQIKITGAPLTAGIGAGTSFSVFCEYEAAISSSDSYVWQTCNDAAPSSNDSIRNTFNTSRAGVVEIMSGGANTFTNSARTLSAPPTLNRIAMRVAANNAAISQNGTAIETDITITLPATAQTRLMLGSAAVAPGVQALNGRITRFAAWPSLLSNADLVALST